MIGKIEYDGNVYYVHELMKFDSKPIAKIELRSNRIRIDHKKKRINILEWKLLTEQEKEFAFFYGYDIYEKKKLF